MIEDIALYNIPCKLYISGEGGDIIVTPFARDHESFADVCRLTTELAHCGFAIVGVGVGNWNDELSPWKAPAAIGKDGFGGDGQQLLDFIVDVCVPHFKQRLGFVEGQNRLYIGGYSLGGLFSLWAFYGTGAFDGAASCSGSLWFPGFESYVSERRAPKGSRVYLSLGDAEELTSIKAFKSVGGATRRLYERIRSDENIVSSALEWNKGDHFADTDERTARGFAYLLSCR